MTLLPAHAGTTNFQKGPSNFMLSFRRPPHVCRMNSRLNRELADLLPSSI